jgi:hypothetical protein
VKIAAGQQEDPADAAGDEADIHDGLAIGAGEDAIAGAADRGTRVVADIARAATGGQQPDAVAGAGQRAAGTEDAALVADVQEARAREVDPDGAADRVAGVVEDIAPILERERGLGGRIGVQQRARVEDVAEVGLRQHAV